MDLVSLLPLVLLVVVFYLLVMRPARARQRDYLATQSALTPGSRVMLTSGIFGELVSVGDVEAELRIAPDTVISVNRQAVSKVVDAVPAVDPESDGSPDA